MAQGFESAGIYYNIIGNGNVEVTYNSSNPYAGTVDIPATVTYDSVTYNVTAIGDSAFCGCGSLTGVTIPNNVSSIGRAAFLGCTSLTAINIPSSVTTLKYGAFSYCSSLQSIHIPSGVVALDTSMFYECSGLISVNIPNYCCPIKIESWGKGFLTH